MAELGIVHMMLVLQVCKMWEWRNYRGFHRGSRKPLVTKYQQEKYLDGSPEWTVCESVKVSPSCNRIPGYGDDIHVRHLLSHQNYLKRRIAYVNRVNSPNPLSLDNAFMHSSWKCLHIYWIWSCFSQSLMLFPSSSFGNDNVYFSSLYIRSMNLNFLFYRDSYLES